MMILTSGFDDELGRGTRAECESTAQPGNLKSSGLRHHARRSQS
ncbi:MAG: hypothetical protein ACAH89_10025 [Rariglobus sp.]